MAEVTQPSGADWSSQHLIGWHQTFQCPWEVMISIGYVKGVTTARANEHVLALAAAQGEVCLDNSDSTIAEKELTSATALYLYSSSGSDTGTYDINGVNEDFERETVRVTAQGNTPTRIPATGASGLDWVSIEWVEAVSAPNLGRVQVSDDAGGAPDNTNFIQVDMSIDDNYAVNPLVTCGDGEILVFKRLEVSVNLRDEVTIHVHRKRHAGLGQWLHTLTQFAYAAEVNHDWSYPLHLAPREKIVLSGIVDTNTTEVSTEFSYYILAAPPGTEGAEGVFHIG